MKSTLLSLFIMTSLLFSFSCKKDDDAGACSTAYGTELQNESNAIQSAATTYGANPTTANCNAFKAAYQAYIDALEPYGNCSALTGQERTDFETSLQASQDALNALTC